MSLQALHKQIQACSSCSLRESCTQVVPGTGEEDADIFILGEGPGADEDAAGVPFVGRSGQLLSSQLTKQQIWSYGVYITNTVRCRPPDNRDPNPQEANACWPWTLKTLQVVKPKVVITLGKPALFIVAAKFKVKLPAGNFTEKVAGKRIYVEDRRFFLYPMTHPAYAQRRKDARSQFVAHMRYLKAAMPGWLKR